MAYDAAEKNGEVYMLGSIVHNEKVVDDLQAVGAKIVRNLSDVPESSPILFRAHGTINSLWQEAHDKKMNIIDATCPLVYEIHHDVKKLAQDGRQIFVIGDHGHDEVVAIADQVNNSIIIANEKEASKLKKYNKVETIVEDYYVFRYALYKTRKEFQINEAKRMAICDCGQSDKSPLCDGTHSKL